MHKTLLINLKSKFLGFLLFISLPYNVFATSNESGFWNDIPETAIRTTGERYTFPIEYRTLHLDFMGMKSFLSGAPKEPANGSPLREGLIFSMPLPDGSNNKFRIFETAVMHADLAAQFPDIKTYLGQGVDDPTATIRIDISPLGFHAMVLSVKGSFFIDPYSQYATEDYICYDKKDLTPSGNFQCGVGDEDPSKSYQNLVNNQKSAGNQLRTYRLAVSCTGEYSATKGGTVQGALAGIVSSVNRVNGVYEQEVAVRLVLIANNTSIIYTNASTDPFTNGNGSTMLGQNITKCNNVIGSSNYDIGHVFSTGGGGVAYLGCVCGSSKAGGVTGSSNPVGDPFDIDYVAHEIGHQFGGNHTFNSVTSSCNGNRSANAAYEPGSGITIMAYAGICGADNLASNSIAYFHTKSFDEIVNFTTTGAGNSCAVTTNTGNIAPVVTSQGGTYSIPISTPFVLTGVASDANGDPLTYSWEQYNLGTAGAWNANLGSSPIFRTFPPSLSPSRTFPKLSDIINNTTTIGEILPNVARTLNFRLTARDNKAGGGGVMHDDISLAVSVVNNGGAFTVTAPNTALTWASGTSQNVTWNVSGTNNTPINCTSVKISLSTDGGNTFPIVLNAITVNDGSEVITVPAIASSLARIKVEALNNIFFDMSNANFTITNAGFSAINTSPVSPVNFCAGASLNVSFTTNGNANAGNTFTAQLSNSSGSFSSPVAIGTLASVASGTIACVIPSGTASGTLYRIRVISSSPVVNGSDNGTNLTISGQVAAAGTISGLTSVCGGAGFINYSINPVTIATTYNWIVPNGAIIQSGAGTSSINVAFSPGASSDNVTVYGSNANCSGSSSSLFVNVLASPATPTAFNVSGCSGAAIALSGSPAGGTFSKANPYTGPSTSYTYTVMNGNGCTSTSAPAQITVNNLPVVSGSNVIGCSGTALNLPGSPSGGTFSVANPYSGASTTYTYSYTDGNGCSNTSTAYNITINQLPVVTAGDVSGCSGSQIVLSGNPAGGNFSIANPYTGPSTTYTYSYTDANGCSNNSSQANVIINPAPIVSFSGLAASYNFNDPDVSLIGSPSGGTFSGIGITGNNFSPSSAGAGGPYNISYSYTDVNGCSDSNIQQTTVGGCTTPLQPGTISAPNGVTACPGDIKNYSVATVNGATSYNWIAPVGAVIISGQGSISIGISYQSGFTTNGTLSVTAQNACGTSISRTLSISRNNPATPSVISGQTAGVCNSSNIPYDVTSVSGITYNWSFNTINGTVSSGQGTNSINASFNTSFTTGILSVTGTNGCGTSAVRSLTINSIPSLPGSITGSSSVCAYQTGVPYSITPVPGAATYTWIGPNGSRISDGTVTSTTNTLTTSSPSITVNYKNKAGNLRVRSNNSCGSSTNRTLAISLVCRQAGVALEEDLQVSFYPNPANDKINISFNSNGGTEFMIRLMDLSGKEVIYISGNSTVGENKVILDVSGLNAGLYLLEVISDQTKTINKVSKL